MVLESLEFDVETNRCYVLGFMRDDENVFDYGFVAIFDSEEHIIHNIHAIDEKKYDYLRSYKQWEAEGFTEKSLEWSSLKSLDHMEVTSIKDVFEIYDN